MDPISQARLDSLRVMDANTFTEDDAAFLRARRSYLSSDEVVKYKDILCAAAEEAPVSEPAEAPAKKASK